MSRTSCILLSLLVAVAASALAATAASASTHVFLIEGTETAKSEKIEVEAANQSVELEATIAKITTNIDCEESLSHTKEGFLEEKGKSKGDNEFKSCYLAEVNSEGTRAFLTSCTVAEPIKTKFTGELTGFGEDTLTGVENKEKEDVFAELEISGSSCALKGKFNLIGSEFCMFPTGESRALQLLICSPVESNLKLDGEPAALYAEEQLKVSGDKKWTSV